MTNRRLFVEIEVAGDATKVFKEIGQSAKSAAQDVMQSGDRAKQGIERIEKAADGAEKEVKELEKAQVKASKAADEMAQHSAKAATSMDKYRSAVASTARGMALLGTAFTLYSRQARDHETTMIAVQRIYGETADSYVAFANQIQNTSIFSNDEALEAAQIMGTLRLNYGLTDEAIQQLIQTSADLATMSGITLTDAAMRVQSAIRGEAESAELLGLTMNQASIDTEGLTLTMSNAEAAQFRFKAMMEQSAFAVGAAGEVAGTTTGRVQQLSNQFQDAMVAVVNFSGPVGDVVAGLSSFGVAGGAAAGGMVQLIRGINDARRAMGGFLPLLGAGGVGIGLGLAAVAGWKLVDAMTGPGALFEATMKTRAQIDAMTESANSMAFSLNNATLGLSLLDSTKAMGQYLDQAQVDLQRMQELWELYGDPFQWQANNADIAAQFPIQADEVQQLIFLMEDYGLSAAEAKTQIDDMLSSWSGIVASGNVQAIEEAVEAWRTFNRSAKEESDWDALHAELTRVYGAIDEYTRAELAAKAATEQQTAALAAQSKALNTHALAQIAANGELQQWLELHGLADQYNQQQANRPNIGSQAQVEWLAKYAERIDVAALAMAGFEVAVRGGDEAHGKFILTVEQSARSVEDLGDEFQQLSADLKGVDIDRVTNEFWDAMRAASGLSDTLYYLRQRMPESFSLDLAVNTTEAQQALGSGFNAIVGGTNSMASLSKQTADWAGSLAHGNIAQTKLDKLLLDGVISRKTYQQALEANHRIQVANNSVQEDVLRIQAKQLPAMAELAESHARYVDSLADASVAEQAAALGFMDQSKAAQAMAIANLNATAALAGMGDAARDTTIAMAEADPYLKAMLLQMGIIKEGAKGEILMNTTEAVSATTVLSSLNDTLSDLNLLLANIFLVTVDVDDKASGPLANIDAAIMNLDGKSATVRINTIGGTVGIFSDLSGAATGAHILPDAHAHAQAILPRGVSDVPGLATGGHLRQIDEAGPEMVVLPTGATVINAAGTRGRLDPLGRIGRRNQRIGEGVTVINKGAVHQILEVRADQLSRRSDRLMRNRR